WSTQSRCKRTATFRATATTARFLHFPHRAWTSPAPIASGPCRTKGYENILSTPNEQLSKVTVAGLGYSELRRRPPGLAQLRLQSKIAANLTTLVKTTRVLQCQDERESGESAKRQA